jgi:hypothetical protein
VSIEEWHEIRTGNFTRKKFGFALSALQRPGRSTANLALECYERGYCGKPGERLTKRSFTMITRHMTFIQLCSEVRRKIPLTLCLALCTLGLGLATGAQEHHILKFDAPSSGTGAYQGTTSTGINLPGTITGNVTDDSYGTHGFVRARDGKFTNFDVPGSDPVVGCTCPTGINDLGLVTGYYIDTNGVGHGFVRTPGGKVTNFDDQDAGTAANQGQGTYPVNINDLGVVAGSYNDTNNVSHGFLRYPGGEMITIDVPGTGTYPGNINNFGFVAGTYNDENFVSHGFVRTPAGKIILFDAPGAVGGWIGTYTALINDRGVIAGSYYDANTNLETGYVREPDGKFATFEAPGAGTAAYAGTQVFAMNLPGAITGFGRDDNFDAQAFVRSPNGKTTTFAIPGQILDGGNDFGSSGWAINTEGVIAGRWRDTNYALHGFIRIP